MISSVFFENLFDKLWPINRSIMGEGIEQSFSVIKEYLDLDYIYLKTGEKVFDWTVPRAWRIRDGAIFDMSGKRVVDVKNNNLHVVSHSCSVDVCLSIDELKKKLHTLPNQKNAIPYVTTYYNEDWGFCVTQDQFNSLNESRYRVKIDADLYDGNLIVGEKILGSKNDPFMSFSSYLCHPSMANNELSGPLILVGLYLAMKKLKLKRCYRFYLFPETIGSLALMSARQKDFSDLLYAGVHLTCIGDSKNYTIKRSRRKTCVTDFLAQKSFVGGKFIEFNPAYGSDDRQFCSPGFNLPYIGISRSIYTDYPEYHTSLDNKEFMNFEKMSETVNDLLGMVKHFDNLPSTAFDVYRRTNPYGEPQLGKRNLFRSFSTTNRSKDELLMWWILNYADASRTLYEISCLAGVDIDEANDMCILLEKNDLIERVNYENFKVSSRN
jgi:aminopeptidase-like protein